MNWRFFLRILSLSLLIIICGVQVAPAEVFWQDFSTKEHCDTLNTTAFWDTVGEQLKLHPFSLELVGSYATPSMAFRVEVQWPYAYVAADESGLIIFDISEPESPQRVGYYVTNAAIDVDVSGMLAYVLDATGEIFLIEISDPTAPSLVDSYAFGTESYSLEVDGFFIYVTGEAGFSVFGVTPMGAIVPVAHYPSIVRINLQVSGDHAYTTGFTGITVFDISDPANPDSVGGVPTAGLAVVGVGISGNTLFVTAETGEFGALNVTDPELISPGDAASLPNTGMFIDVAGDYAYAAYQSGVAVLDITNPMEPQLLYTKGIAGNEVSDVDVYGEYVYVTAGNDGLQIYRAAHPVMPPLPAGSNGIPVTYREITIEGDNAFVSGGSNGVRTVDITDPAGPYQLGGYSTGGYVNGVTVSGNVAYVADGYGDFKILDITDPSVPSLLGSYATISTQDNDVAVDGDLAYVCDYTAGMYIFDVSDPANPDSVGFYPSGNVAWGVEAAWPFVYLADGADGLRILDVSDPSSPTMIGSYNTPGDGIDVVVEGIVAVVADGFQGVQVLDVTDPTDPNLVASFDTPDFAAAVALDLPFIYVADRDSGVQVMDLTNPSLPVRLANIPTSGQCRAVTVAGDYLFYGVDNVGFFSTQVWERTHDIENNVAQSVVMHTSAQVDRIKLDAFPTDSISWEASADNGANWQLLPSGAWHDLTYPGEDLILRATLNYETYHHYPVCDSMSFELEAGIVSVLITNIEAAAEGSGIRVKWDIAADENIRGFNLYRTAAGGLAGQLNGLQLIPPGQRSFIDQQAQPGVLYEYRLGAVKQDGEEIMSRAVAAKVPVQTLALEQNYPNPFNPSTTIAYSLPERMRVRIAVYNPEGRLVKLLLNRIMSAGHKTIGWNGTDAAGNPVASGIYFYQMKVGTKTFTRKMMLLK